MLLHRSLGKGLEISEFTTEAVRRKLADAAGVPVTHSDYAGQIHGFWNFTGRIDAAFEARAEACAALSKAFAAV